MEGWKDSEASPPAAAACGGALPRCPGAVNLLAGAASEQEAAPEDLTSCLSPVIGSWPQSSYAAS